MTRSPNTALLSGNPAGLPLPARELRSLLRDVTVRVQARDSRAEREWLRGWRADTLLALQEDDLDCLAELAVELAQFDDWLRTTLPIPDELLDE